jgi:methylated-DNA-[protein]-cysteine S-methyltransferase
MPQDHATKTDRREYRIQTSLGCFLCAWAGGCLTRLLLPGTYSRRKPPPELLQQEGDAGIRLVRQLRLYARGRPAVFHVPQTPARGDFEERARNAMRRIPRGCTVTYARLAMMAGSPGAARAAGSACRRNPLPIVNPCHRVVAASGIGGFGPGIRWKIRLLEIEGWQAQTGPRPQGRRPD